MYFLKYFYERIYKIIRNEKERDLKTKYTTKILIQLHSFNNLLVPSH